MEHSSKKSTGSILDTIFEKTANIETAINANTINDHIETALKQHSRRERNVRESTITINHNDNYDHEKIVKIINEWIEGTKDLAPTIWQDKLHTYCQTDSSATKQALLNYLRKQDVKQLITLPDQNGWHFIRRPAKIEIANTKTNLSLESIKDTLTKVLLNSPTRIREGKANSYTKTRSIFFDADDREIKILFQKLDGHLPYYNNTNNIRTKLQMRINVKPWQCRECFKIGKHNCGGKQCGNCGAKDHAAKECKNDTKFCTNCRRKGHKAKEAHCGTYLNEIIREIKRTDIPIEFYEEDDLRFRFTKFLQIK